MRITTLLLKSKKKAFYLSFFLICGIIINTYSYLGHFKFLVVPTATISSSSTEVCKDEPVTITFTGSGGVTPYTFTYTLNGGTEETITSSGTDSFVDIINDGTTTGDFTYTLTKVKDSSADPEEIITGEEITVTVNEPPIVDFSFTNNNACSGTSIQFTSNSTGTPTLTYAWDFGDGTTSTIENPTHIYDVTGCGTRNFNVALTVTDGNTCSTTSAFKTVTVLEKPELEFEDDSLGNFNNCGSPSAGYSVEVKDIAQSSCLNGGYTIDWGDGTPPANVTFPATHLYTVGTFEMKISAEGTNGCTNEVTYIVKNISNPTGGFGTTGATSNICSPALVSFNISGWGENALGTTYTIDFGDGNSQNFTQLMLNSSVYYNTSSPADSAPFPVTHTYNDSSCSMSGGFEAVLTIENACLTSRFTAGNITVLGLPEPKFESQDSGCVDTPITFTNTSIIGDSPGCVKSAIFEWDFGDGTIVTGSSTPTLIDETHTYTTPGTYEVTLTETSFCGTEISTTKQICIEPEFVAIEILVDTDEGCIGTSGLDVAVITAVRTFSCTSSTAPVYEWEVTYTAANCGTTPGFTFTNGTDQNSEKPEFNFTQPGEYTLTQKTTTDCGTVTSTKIINVKKPPTVIIDPISDYCLTASTNTITPVATVENCNSGTVTYLWTFTDGTPSSSNLLDPGTIIYTTSGLKTVKLEVTNECGPITATQTFDVFETPSITNAVLTQEICSGQTTTAIDLEANTGTTFTWAAIASTGITGFTASGNSSTIPAQTLINSTTTSGTVTYTVTPTLDTSSAAPTTCPGDPVDFIITVKPTPVFTSTGQPESSTVCIGGMATLLEVAFENSSETPTYQWFSNTTNNNTGGTSISGATNATFNPPTNTIGTLYYYVELTFPSGGCNGITSDTASVTVLDQLTIAPTTNQTKCIGGTADDLIVTYNGGTGNPTYQWYENTSSSNTGGTPITGATNDTYNPTPPTFTVAGTFYYYVEVSLTGSGCNSGVSGIYQIDVIANPIIDTQAITTQELCLNTAPTDLTVTVSGGSSAAKEYQWYRNTINNTTSGTPISGATSATFTPPTTASGTLYYYVIVSQPGSDCSVTSETSEVIINETPSISSQPVSSEICLGGTADLLEVEYQNGSGIPTYQWFSNATNSTTGGTLIPTAVNASYNPNTNPLTSTVGITYYYVELTFPSSGGCSTIFSIPASIIVNPIPTINNAEITISSGDTFNFTPDAAIPGNSIPTGTQYTWTIQSIIPAGIITGASAETTPQNLVSQTLTNTSAPPVTAVVTYTITPITPTTPACTGNTFTLKVIINSSINSNAIVTNISCNGANDGQISTNIAGGVIFDPPLEPYKITWTGPSGFTSTSATITGLEPGLYILKIEDKEGVTITEDYTITQPDILAITTDVEENISCFEGSDGKIETTISGGTLPYTYLWSTTDGSGIIAGAQNQNTLTAGTYTLVVEDANMCTVTTNFTLTEPAVELQITAISKTDVLCFGDATGSLTPTIEGGTTPYTYEWKDPSGTIISSLKDISGLVFGNYTLKVTDTNLCTTSSNITINQPSDIAITVTKTNITCNGNNDGSIILSISGGVAPYRITWNDLNTGPTRTNLSAGIYIATIRDDNDCEKTETIEILQPDFSITPIVTPIVCNGDSNGSIDLMINGGVAPITVIWDDDATAGVQRNNLPPGTYRVTITDSNPEQCPIEETFTFTDPPAIAVSSTVVNAVDCTIVNSGSIELDVSGGTPPYTFLWNTGATTEDLADISQGDYSVEIKDDNGCFINRNFNIFRQLDLTINFNETIRTVCDLKTTEQETEASVTGGFPPYTYSWSAGTISGADSNIMTTSQNGSYELKVTDNNGCMESKTILINIPIIGDTEFTYTAFALTNYGLLSIEDPIEFTNLSTGDYTSIKWDFGDGSPISTDVNPTHTYDEIGPFTVTLTVTYDNGCSYTFKKILNITLGYTIVNPTAFTPNGDAFNDTIRPSYLGFTELEMIIYDIWGTTIYYEKGTNLKGWDGSLRNKPTENGNYVMVVKGLTFYNREIITTTTVTLIK